MGDERLRDGRRETRDLRLCVWHGGGGWWVEVWGCGPRRELLYHLLNIGNSRHIFDTSPNTESFKKIQIRRH